VSTERSGVGVGGTALVSKLQLLAPATTREIDHWVAKFPPGRQRSACIAALRAAQEQNHGFLTADLMDAVAEYLKLHRSRSTRSRASTRCSRPTRAGVITSASAPTSPAC
jgi:hypothetical protein